MWECYDEFGDAGGKEEKVSKKEEVRGECGKP